MRTTPLPLDLVTAVEMRAAEAAVFASGVESFTLMQRAGEAAADVIRARYAGVRRVLVLCGPGNNGGDGFVVARALRDAGLAPTVACLVDTTALKGDAARAAADWAGPVTPSADIDPAGFDLIVDALFGIGLTRQLADTTAKLVDDCNASGRPIVAIDIPSGIDVDTGAVLGSAIRATDTVTFFRLKPAHLLEPGRSHAGEIHCADIGIADRAPAPLGVTAFRNAPALWSSHLPRLSIDAHKFKRGHALILAGGIEGVGAARLTARAALRAGAGLVTIGVPSEALVAHASRGPDALMIRRCDGPGGLDALFADRRRNAIAIGPAYGLGAATCRTVERVLAAGRATVLDADALTAFAQDPDRLFAAIGKATAPVVLTPHAGEFARLFGLHEAPSGKLVTTCDAARRCGATVLHKGPDTVIAAPDGRAAINTNGTPHLATAGSGDVLAGIVTGLLAQGMPAFEAACAAVWLHADTATLLGAGLIADDLVDHLPKARARLGA